MSTTGKARGKSRAYEDPFYEDRVQEAIAGAKSGKYKDLKAAAVALNVKYSTVTDRASGRHRSFKDSVAKSRALDTPQEDVLVEWAGHHGDLGQPMDKRAIRDYASDLAGRRLGTHYVPRFLRRHPEILVAKAVKLDPKRAKNFNKAVVKDFFEKLLSLIDRYGPLPASHIWNMDEKGIQLGGGRKNSNRKFVFFRKRRNRYKISSDNLELVTIIECICAAGFSMPPSFVLSDGFMPDVTNLPDGSIGSVGTSPSGWTDDELTHKWVEEVFIPHARKHAEDPTKPILLIYDGHGSHETPELQQTVYDTFEDGGPPVILFCFPSKCTHKMQPLDVVVFAHSQRSWREYCDDCIYRGITMNRYNVIQHYLTVRNSHLTPELVKKSFEVTGLYPYNPAVFTEQDFAPSKVSSTQVHVPDSYPEEMPSSDAIEPSDDEQMFEAGPVHEAAPRRGGEDNTDSTVCKRTWAEYLNSGGGDFESDSEDEDFEGDGDFLLSESSEDDSEYDLDDYDDDDVGTDGVDGIEGAPQSNVRHSSRLSPGYDKYAKVDDLLQKCLRDMAVFQIKEDARKTEEELLEEVFALRKQVNSLSDALRVEAAASLSSQAHCTVMSRQVEVLQTRLDNSAKQNKCGSTKVKARFLTHEDLKERFRQEQAAREVQERIDAENDAKKLQEVREMEDRIREGAVSRTFDLPLGSYRKKEDVRTLARALGLPESAKSKVDDLVTSIRSHMDERKDHLEQNARFSGLFAEKRPRTRQPKAANHQEAVDAEVPVPGPSSSHPVPSCPPLFYHSQPSSSRQPSAPFFHSTHANLPYDVNSVPQTPPALHPQLPVYPSRFVDSAYTHTPFTITDPYIHSYYPHSYDSTHLPQH